MSTCSSTTVIWPITSSITPRISSFGFHDISFSLSNSIIIPYHLPLFTSLLLNFVQESDEIVTNLSIIQDWRWFFRLTPFETMFLGFILFHICVLQYIGILPMNINNYLGGDPSGKKRRKRKKRSYNMIDLEGEKRNLEFMEAMLTTLHRVDQNKCMNFALCELQNYALESKLDRLKKKDNKISRLSQLPKGIQLILDIFSTKFRNTDHTAEFPEYWTVFPMPKIYLGTNSSAIQLYADAVNYGQETFMLNHFGPTNDEFDSEEFSKEFLANSCIQRNKNNTNLCLKHYPSCELTIDMILDYINDIQFEDIF